MILSRMLTGPSAVVMQFTVIFFSLTMFIILLVGPHYEGRNQGASWDEIYFNDPLLAYVYIGSSAFFAAMYHCLRFLQHTTDASSHKKDLLYHIRHMRLFLITLMGFVVGFAVYLAVVQRKIEEDIAGGISMSLLVLTAASLTVAATIAIENKLRNQK